MTDLQADESVTSRINNYTDHPSIDLYTRGQPSSQLAHELEKKLCGFDDHASALEVASIYSRINIHSNITHDMQYKRAILYQLYVVIVFAVVSMLYVSLIFPKMSEIFNVTDIPMTPGFRAMLSYGWLQSLALIVALSFSLIIGFKLKRAFRFSPDFSSDWIIRLFAFPSIKKAHATIVEALMFPVLAGNHAPGLSPNSLVSSHLLHVQQRNMCVAQEIEVIVTVQSEILARQCEKQIRYITIVIGLLIVHVLTTFLLTAYVPIFKMGEVI